MINSFDRLVLRASETHSNSLLVVIDGKVCLETYRDRLPPLMPLRSVTKSVVSLVVGHLIDTGRLKSVETPVCTFFPQWGGDPRSQITIQHLLTHTSGLAVRLNAEQIESPDDVVKQALEAELESEPGSRFAYDNVVVNLLSGIVERAAGQQLDEYAKANLFGPLGINEVEWVRDRHETALAMAGLSMKAPDLVKLGQLVLNQGMWQGKRILSAEWIAESTRPAMPWLPDSGYLWWLVPKWSRVTVTKGLVRELADSPLSSPVLDKFRRLQGKTLKLSTLQSYFSDAELQEWQARLKEGIIPGLRSSTGVTEYIMAVGDLGQYLIINPRQKLVVVRQIGDSDYQDKRDSFPDILDEIRYIYSSSKKGIRALSKSSACAASRATPSVPL